MDDVKVTIRIPRSRYGSLRVKLLQEGLSVQSLFDCLEKMFSNGDLPPSVTERARLLQSERKEAR